VKLFTFKPNPDQNIRFVLRGLPPKTDSDEVMAGLKEIRGGDLLCLPNQEKRHGGWCLLCDAPPTMGYHNAENRGEYHLTEVVNWYIEFCVQNSGLQDHK
jgi:hypothetical protein